MKQCPNPFSLTLLILKRVSLSHQSHPTTKPLSMYSLLHGVIYDTATLLHKFCGALLSIIRLAFSSQLQCATNIAWCRPHGLRPPVLSIAPNICKIRVRISKAIPETWLRRRTELSSLSSSAASNPTPAT